MSEQVVAGHRAYRRPDPFNAGFALLGQRFDYPDVLRRPSHEVLAEVAKDGFLGIEVQKGRAVVMDSPLVLTPSALTVPSG